MNTASHFSQLNIKFYKKGAFQMTQHKAQSEPNLAQKRCHFWHHNFRQRKKYEDLIRKRDNLLKDIEQLSNELEANVDAIWKDYKKSYLKYVNNNEEG